MVTECMYVLQHNGWKTDKLAYDVENIIKLYISKFSEVIRSSLFYSIGYF